MTLCAHPNIDAPSRQHARRNLVPTYCMLTARRDLVLTKSPGGQHGVGHRTLDGGGCGDEGHLVRVTTDEEEGLAW